MFPVHIGSVLPSQISADQHEKTTRSLSAVRRGESTRAARPYTAEASPEEAASMQIDPQEMAGGNGGALPRQPEQGQAPPAAQSDDVLVAVNRFLQRFNGSPGRLVVVRTFQKCTGERYRRVSYQPWLGL